MSPPVDSSSELESSLPVSGTFSRRGTGWVSGLTSTPFPLRLDLFLNTEAKAGSPRVFGGRHADLMFLDSCAAPTELCPSSVADTAGVGRALVPIVFGLEGPLTISRMLWHALYPIDCFSIHV